VYFFKVFIALNSLTAPWPTTLPASL